MKIVHLLNHTRRANGHVELAVDLACEQAASGHDVTVLAGAGDFGSVLERNGVRFLELETRGGALERLRMMYAVMALCRDLRPDVVNAHMVASALAARLAKVRSRFALVTTVHNSFDKQARLMGVGDRVIAVSDAVRREMIGKGIAATKLRTVHNGTIGGKRRVDRPLDRATLGRPSITTVAGLHGRKGVDILIDAFAIARRKVADAQLYIVGDGPDREMLSVRAAACSGAIHFLGYIADPRVVLASTDIFVLASRAEPCGLALIEARQMGCACVASDVGGIPEVLEFGARGRLFPPSRPDLLADILIELLENRKTLLDLSANATLNIDYWSVARMASDTIAVYEDAAENCGVAA